jgi:hypothetical protein
MLHNQHNYNSIPFLFTYVLSSTANGQLQSQNEHKQQQYDSTAQNKQKATKK